MHYTENDIGAFHASLPSFEPSHLNALQVSPLDFNLFLKDESSRAGLPAFKILGASWAAHLAILQFLNLSVKDVPSVSDLARILRERGEGSGRRPFLEIVLYAATEGNHGRAVARMAKVLGIKARIFVAEHMVPDTRRKIASEGGESKSVEVVVVNGDYNDAVQSCWSICQVAAEGALLIQDTAFKGYEQVPTWIVEGYSTMLREVDFQLTERNFPRATHVVVPVGVGSLAQAVVTHYKQSSKTTKIITVEPETANCLQRSLQAGRPVTINTVPTIMAGMNCGTVSPLAWPILRDGVDASVAVSDLDSHSAVLQLRGRGYEIGPCGGATLAALRKVLDDPMLKLDKSSVVVLLCTEGARHYEVPR